MLRRRGIDCLDHRGRVALQRRVGRPLIWALAPVRHPERNTGAKSPLRFIRNAALKGPLFHGRPGAYLWASSLRASSKEQPDGLELAAIKFPPGELSLRLQPGTMEETMPKYVIERDIPGAGQLTPDQLQGISQKSCGILKGLGSQIQWLHSYVTGDKIYCVYTAPNQEMIKEHAKQGGFPANRISEVKTMISPSTAEK